MSRLRMGLILGGIVGSIPACLSGSDTEPLGYACPSATGFELVSQVMERRCGTLDCHGDPGRPLRIFSRTGLRAGAGLSGSTTQTTAEEIRQNRFSACGLEPEQMDAVVAGDADVGSLTLLRKPRLVEAHKGGEVAPEGSLVDACVVSWLRGAVDEVTCEGALLEP